MGNTDTDLMILHPRTWPRWARGVAVASLTHIILSALATAAQFGIVHSSEACLDRYNRECRPPLSRCPEERYTECDPPLIVSSAVAALQTGPGPVILVLPFLFLRLAAPDLSWVDPALLMFWIPQLVSLTAYSCAGALAFNYVPPRIAAILLLFVFVIATGAATFWWALWLGTI
jgi:hypothetical protein